MFMNGSEYYQDFHLFTVGGGITLMVCTSIFVSLITTIPDTSWYGLIWTTRPNQIIEQDLISTSQQIGVHLSTDFFLPFELISIILLAALIGAPIAPPNRTKMGPQRKLRIYVGYDSPSIVRYLEIQTGDVFKARFANCHFDESKFSTLGGENKLPEKELNWNASSLMHLDPRSGQCELEVQKIIHLQRIANELPDAFSDTKRITKSYIPAENAPI
ncbi:hypothetical protein Ahy_A07g031457 isoform B [Arachis hypogaea]|nr:hypothetical protein Ahy_A07g031457 isoform B [Arachis hypogaea]